MRGFVGDNVADGTARSDGTVSVTVRNDGDEFISAPGEHQARLEDAEDPDLFAQTSFRVTVLDAATAADGAQVVGTGFEPGTAVQLLIGGTERASGTADSSGRVQLDSPVGGTQDVVLRGPAGEVTRTLDLIASDDAGVDAETIAQVERAAQVVDDLKANRSQLATILGDVPPGGGTLRSGTEGLLREQVELQEQLLGAPLPSAGGISTVPGGRVTLDAQAQEKDREALYEQAEAQYEQTQDDLAKEQQEALEDIMKQIIAFLREMQDAEVQQMRALTRLSVPEVLSVAPLPANGIVSVDVPAGFTGDHHVALVEPSSGVVTVWQPFTVVEAGDEVLPDTGAPAGRLPLAAAALCLLAGASVLTTSRRRNSLS